MLHLQNRKPKLWGDIQQKFDPTGEDTIRWRANVGL